MGTYTVPVTTGIQCMPPSYDWHAVHTVPITTVSLDWEDAPKLRLAYSVYSSNQE